MDPITLTVIGGIFSCIKRVKERCASCATKNDLVEKLVDRTEGLGSALEQVRGILSQEHARPLNRAYDVVKNVTRAVDVLDSQSKWTAFLSTNSNLQKLEDLHVDLTHAIQSLQLAVSVDTLSSVRKMSDSIGVVNNASGRYDNAAAQVVAESAPPVQVLSRDDPLVLNPRDEWKTYCGTCKSAGEVRKLWNWKSYLCCLSMYGVFFCPCKFPYNHTFVCTQGHKHTVLSTSGWICGASPC